MAKVMRLPMGIVPVAYDTFGELKFSALRREVYEQNEDGTASNVLERRVYDLKCKGQGCMVQVSIPASVQLKEFDYNAEVEMINPIPRGIANATFQSVDANWHVNADDIILKKSAPVQTNPQPQKKYPPVEK